jgi:hypothetical protein
MSVLNWNDFRATLGGYEFSCGVQRHGGAEKGAVRIYSRRCKLNEHICIWQTNCKQIGFVGTELIWDSL